MNASISFIRAALLIVPLLLFSSCTTTEPVQQNNSSRAPAVTEIERPLPYPIDIPAAYQRAVENGTRTENGAPGPQYWQNEASYNLSATIDPSNHTLNGRASVTYYNHSPNDLEVIVVELAQNLHKEGTPKKEQTEITGGKQIATVAANGEKLDEITPFQRWTQQSPGYIIEGTQLYLFPENMLDAGSSIELDFEWSFTIPEQGASGRMGRSRDNLYFIGYWYPHIAVYDDVYGWMDDSFLGNAEFYHKFSDYELSVTMPREWIVMGTGEFVNPDEILTSDFYERYRQAGESDSTFTIASFDELGDVTRSDSDSLTWNFRAERVRDVAFSATLESTWEGSRTPVGDLTGDGQTDFTRIHTFYRDTAPLWSEQTEYARHSIRFLSDYLQMPYPWPHMTSVEGAEIIGGGMEFPMITIIGDYTNAGAVPLYGVTAHELAHMWFPMIVSTNERRYTWIDEGYTTFHTNEANIDFFGDRFDHNDVFGGYLQIAGSDLEGEIMRWSDYHYPGPAYGVASYPKPASVLIALRGVLGEEVFMDAHHEILKRWSYKHPYPWDLFRTIEDVSGRDLSWFWRAWLYETWFLNQSVADVYEDDGGTVILIEDLGDIPMPVFLEITFDDGSVTTQSISEEHWLKGFRSYELRVDSDREVIRVQIDPDNHFPDADTRNLVWERNS
jgi:hypothetical protein